MKNLLFASLILGSLSLSAATGQHIKSAVLQSRTGATVASAQADMNGLVRFTHVPPGEYRLVLTNADGRSVTVTALDGDGKEAIFIEGDGKAGSPAAPGAGGGAGKVSVSSFNIMKAAPAAGEVTAPRDHSSGLPTGKRMHKPYCCVVEWSGAVKGGFLSEADAKAAGQRLPASPSGACAVKVVCDSQPGTIEVQSYSWGLSQSGSSK